MKKFNFQLTIEWKYGKDYHRVVVEKTLLGKNYNATYRRAKKWVDNCLAICGKDNLNRIYTNWTLRFIGNQ